MATKRTHQSKRQVEKAPAAGRDVADGPAATPSGSPVIAWAIYRCRQDCEFQGLKWQEGEHVALRPDVKPPEAFLLQLTLGIESLAVGVDSSGEPVFLADGKPWPEGAPDCFDMGFFKPVDAMSDMLRTVRVCKAGLGRTAPPRKAPLFGLTMETIGRLHSIVAGAGGIEACPFKWRADFGVPVPDLSVGATVHLLRHFAAFCNINGAPDRFWPYFDGVCTVPFAREFDRAAVKGSAGRRPDPKRTALVKRAKELAAKGKTPGEIGVAMGITRHKARHLLDPSRPARK